MSQRKIKGSSAAQCLTYCIKLFEIEKSLANLLLNKQYIQRLKQKKYFVGMYKLCRKPRQNLHWARHLPTYLYERAEAVADQLSSGRQAGDSNNWAEWSINLFCN